jgi:ribonucleoside-diphosphate reductase alpha chain
LAGIVYTRIEEDDDEQYFKSCKYALKMIDYCIHNSTYELPHIGYTAKQRMNAAVGLLDVANHMAKKYLPYNSKAGMIELHKIAERHSYFMIKAALELGKQYGNAPWIDKTKWPEGWLPVDTYNRNVDSIANFTNRYDWEELRKEIIVNKGIRFSSLVAHMPTESSSKAAGAMNGIYPARSLTMIKTDGTNAVEWAAPGGDVYGAGYQMAWELTILEQVKIYAIFQKWADQSISADVYRDRSGDNLEIKHSELLDEFAAFVHYGVKSRYYSNSLTGDSSESQATVDGCASGACTL